MLAQLSGKVEADGGLDLPTGDGVLLVVVRQARSFGGDALEDVVHERVHDAHRLAGDTGIGVDLPQDLVDVDGVALLAGLPLFLLALSRGLGLLGGGLLLALLGCYFARHGRSFENGELSEAYCGAGKQTFLMVARLLRAFYFKERDHFRRIAT